MTLCACGCGKEIIIKRHHKWYGVPKVITGHCTEETKRKHSEVHKGKPTWNKGIPSGRKGIKLIPCPAKRKRKISVAKKGIPSGLNGNKNPNWCGGISFLPYCQKFNRKLKQAIKERDNHICQLCGATDKRLSVHHIHYDKENCYPDLITVCNSDNSKVNFNRKHYENLFMNKLNDRELLFWTLSLYKEKDNVDVEEV